MYLLLLSTLLSFVSVHSNIIGKPILRWINRPTSIERDLLQRKQLLKHEQSLLNMSDHFAKYSKLQRKINAIDQELLETHNQRAKNSFTVKLISNYGTKVFFAIVLLSLSIYFRYTPVIKLNSNLDLTPFSHLISYPNEENMVSFHFWVMCCTAVAKLIRIK